MFIELLVVVRLSKDGERTAIRLVTNWTDTPISPQSITKS